MVQDIEKLLLPTLDALSAHIAVLSPESTIIFVNSAWRAFAEKNGIHPDSVSAGVNYLDVCQGASNSGCDQAEDFLNGLKQVVSGREESFSLEYPCHSDTEKRWFIGKISAFTIKKECCIVVSHEDITERKLNEIKLENSENRLTSIVENSPHIIFTIDRTGAILFMNHAPGGVELNQVIGTSMYTHINPEYRKRVEQHVADIFNGEKNIQYEVRGIGPGGKQSDYLSTISPYSTCSGKVMSAIISTQDITIRKQSEKKVQESEIKLKAIIDNSPAVIFMKNLEGRYLLINRKCEELLELKNEDIVGKTTHDILPKKVAEQFIANDRKVIETGRPQKVEEIIPIDDGFLTVLSVQFPLRDAAGKMYGICGISTDITERKHLERELKRSNQQLEDKVKERTMELEDMNAALKILLKRNEKDKAAIEEKILSSYESIILPFVTKLKKISPGKKHENLLDIIESNLMEVTSVFSKRLNDPIRCLTPTEIQIAAMVKQGLTNKEIADVMNVAVRTVTSHRDAIRTKLGIKNQKVNLMSYLSRS